MVVCGIPTHTPTTMTAGNAVEKSPSQLVVTVGPNSDRTAFRGPLVE